MNYCYRATTQDNQKLQGIIDTSDEHQTRLWLREEGLSLPDTHP